MFLEGIPGTHPLTPVCGSGYFNLVILKFYYCAFTLDTLVSSGIAIAATLGIAFFVASRLTPGVPSKLQMVLEFLLDYTRNLVKDTVSEDATFIIPIAATIGLYILVANWIDALPLGFSPYVKPANADLNQTLAMAIVVMVIVTGYAIKVRGIGGYIGYYFRPPFPPLTIIEEVQKPITLALRLFGNLFAGLLMVYVISLLAGLGPVPALGSAVLIAIWKSFDVFIIGSLQALIFMLLTIIYFGQVREGLDEEHHHQSGGDS
jgi:F-type H+-transporting ATPase subunit a